MNNSGNLSESGYGTDLKREGRSCGRYSMSEKAYNDFVSRINETLKHDEKACQDALSMFFNYINGVKHDPMLSESSEIARVAFMMIRSEIDRAMQRSRSARERAERRRGNRPVKAKVSKKTKAKDDAFIKQFIALFKSDTPIVSVNDSAGTIKEDKPRLRELCECTIP